MPNYRFRMKAPTVSQIQDMSAIVVDSVTPLDPPVTTIIAISDAGDLQFLSDGMGYLGYEFVEEVV